MDEPGEIPEEKQAAPDAGSSEIPSNEEVTESLNDPMEVHHHPDIHHKKKKFREYILEFLMIFLAVTLGFFAESLRERISENTRAKEYAIMLMKDVIKDTVQLEKQLKDYQESISSIDTFQMLRATQKDRMNDFDFWYYGYPAFTAGRMSFEDATLQQLKSSGNLRYFRSLKLKEKISEYDNITRAFSLRLEIELNWVPVLIQHYTSLFNYDVRQEMLEQYHDGISNDTLRKRHYVFLIRDQQEINRFLNFADYRKKSWAGRIDDNIAPTLQVARDLIAMLKSEYGFSEKE
jgi:hypothetical protein